MPYTTYPGKAGVEGSLEANEAYPYLQVHQEAIPSATLPVNKIEVDSLIDRVPYGFGL